MIIKKALLVLCFMNFCGIVIADNVTASQEINLEKELAKMKAYNGDETYQDLLSVALAGGSEALVKKILQEKRDVVNLAKRAGLGQSLLFIAMFQKDNAVNKKMVQLLLDEGFDANTVEPANLGGSSLHAAVFQGRLGAVEALVAAGADVNGYNLNGLVPDGNEALIEAPEHAEKVTPLRILFYDWRCNLGEERVKMLQWLITNGAFVGGVHDSYTIKILTHKKPIRFSSELKTLEDMEDLLTGVMIEKTLQEECPFSGILR